MIGSYATSVSGETIRVGDAVRLPGGAPLRRVAAVMHAFGRTVHRR